MRVLLPFLLVVLFSISPPPAVATSLVVEEVSIDQRTPTTNLVKCGLTLLEVGGLRAIEVRVTPSVENEGLRMALLPEAPDTDVRLLPTKQMADDQLFALIFPKEEAPAAFIEIGAFECEFPSGAPAQPVFSAFIVGDAGRLEEIPVSYVELQADDFPARRLLSVSPNPAARSVEIRYVVPASSELDLSVYDPAGRRVRTLHAGSQTAGEHVTTWNGTDESGRPVPAGVFFTRLRTADGTWTQKVVLFDQEGE